MSNQNQLLLCCFIVFMACHQLSAINLKGQVKMNYSSIITTSGVSSGGYFANQFHVIFSKQVKAAGIFAAGPFYCSQGQVYMALTTCMNQTGATIPLNTSISMTNQLDSQGLIDHVSNLNGSNVWLFSGQQDTLVLTPVVQALGQYYQNFGANVTTTFNIPAEHSWVNNVYGSACNYLGSPYIDNCNQLNAVEAMLTTVFQGIISPIKPPVAQIAANLFTFNQTKYLGNTTNSLMLDTGYLYIPTICQQKTQTCYVHVVFHGCQMSTQFINEQFVTNTNLNEYAESNNIVVFYPQVGKSTMVMTNPNGCWDWWGYTSVLIGDSQWVTKKGVQPSVIMSMVQAIISS